MDVNSKAYKELLKKRPLNVQARFGSEGIGLVSGRDIIAANKEVDSIVLAANARHPLVIKAVLKAAKKKNAAVLIELAKSESTYCGANFDNIPEYALQYSQEMGHGAVFGLHVDHYAIKNQEDVLKGVGHLNKILMNGFTSVAIDASHLEDYDNFVATRSLAGWLPSELGLEVEVGEIKGPGELSTVEEASYFIGGLNAWGVFPDYLAISNGSLHGTYDPTVGQMEGIDLRRTKEIADAIEPYGVTIAQHGISGTPLDKCSTFRKYGIRKGNVATLFQNIYYGVKMDPDTGNAITDGGAYIKESDRGITVGLWEKIVAAGDELGMSRKSGDYKKLNLPFYEMILNEPQPIIDRIVDEMQYWAEKYIDAFGAAGSADAVAEVMSRRPDHNASPDRKIIASRKDYTAGKAPKTGGNDGKNYDD
ncbi:MAG: class II fructose-bisphosphate aldolase [Synergistaceae bacterium]|jgi:fructose/tagatose bisphosphate aldolase|nr:class II fructose-bisphosphate aldolase [Synergistaceae bacterium]